MIADDCSWLASLLSFVPRTLAAQQRDTTRRPIPRRTSCRPSRWSAASSRPRDRRSARAFRRGSRRSTPRRSMPTSRASCPTRSRASPDSPPTTISAAHTSSTSRAVASTRRRSSGLPQGVAVFLDGVRMNEPEASQVNFDLLPMDHISRIEVLSGNGSLLGRNALGGAVNLVTTRGARTAVGDDRAFGGQLRRGARRGPRIGSHAGWSGLVRRRELQPRGRLAAGYGGRAVSGLRQPREAGHDGRRPLPGLLLALDSAETGRLAPRVDLRGRAPTPISPPATTRSSGRTRDRVQAYKQFGLGRASATAYFRRHRAERFNVNQADDPDAFGISYNTSFGYTADYRWTTVINDRTALSLRGGVDGEVTRVNIDIFADSTKFGAGRDLTTQARSPLWDIAPVRRRRPHHRQGDALRRARDTTMFGFRSRTRSIRRSIPSGIVQAPQSTDRRQRRGRSRAGRSSLRGVRRSAPPP